MFGGILFVREYDRLRIFVLNKIPNMFTVASGSAVFSLLTANVTSLLNFSLTTVLPIFGVLLGIGLAVHYLIRYVTGWGGNGVNVWMYYRLGRKGRQQWFDEYSGDGDRVPP